MPFNFRLRDVEARETACERGEKRNFPFRPGKFNDIRLLKHHSPPADIRGDVKRFPRAKEKGQRRKFGERYEGGEELR